MAQALPVVSIVGRPNVGKSSLFNRILGDRVAVVDDMPGVTRDRNYHETTWDSHTFRLVDTGGLDPATHDTMVASINRQVEHALRESSAIIFLMETDTGVTDIDLLVARDLRKRAGDRVVLAINKAEAPNADLEMGVFHKLGLGEPIPVSALHGKGIGDLLSQVCTILGKPRPLGISQPADLCIAIVGRPNAGKSSLVNRLLNQERMIVDASPGTTRDAIDSTIVYKGTLVTLIDTAGLRRKAQVHDKVEYYTNLRAVSSISRADIVVLLIDAEAGIASQDLKILSMVNKARKGMIVCLSKWDLVKKDHKTFEQMVAFVRTHYREMKHVPVISFSSLTGQRARNIIDEAIAIRNRMRPQLSRKIVTEAMFKWIRANPHPFDSAGEVRFLGGKVVDAPFPFFEFYCTNPDNVKPGYEQYLANKIHETWDLCGCPIGFSFKPAGKSRKNK